MDIRKHDTAGPEKQSERFLRFVRTHRYLVGVLAAVLVVGFAVWLTWTVTGQVRRGRVAVALEALQQRGETWESDRDAALKAQQQSEAEALLPPPNAAKSNPEEAQGKAEQPPLTSGGEQTPAATSDGESPDETPDQQVPIVTADKESPVAESDQQTPVAKVDQNFSTYLQQLIEDKSDAVVKVEALWWQTRLREKKEDFSGAQESLAKIYQDFPRQPSARAAQMRSAILYYQQQQDEQAIEQWDLLRAGDDGVALTATLHLGMVRTRRGEYQQARALLERFLNESAKVQQTEGWQDLADSYLLALDVLEKANNDGEGRQAEPPVVAPAPTAESQSAQQ